MAEGKHEGSEQTPKANRSTSTSSATTQQQTVRSSNGEANAQRSEATNAEGKHITYKQDEYRK